MKEVRTSRSTRMALPSATSTWRTAAKHERAPIQISPGHLEKEQQLENALDEYCLLRAQDRSLTASRFCERYPSYRHSLRRLIDVHDAMEGQPALDDENWPELFTEFLGYEILHELGVGAIARVYLATEAALGGRLVAIKVAREGGYEAETLGRLSHPNVVPVYSVKHDEQTDLTAVCMPYHGSATLADLLEIGFQNGKPPITARAILDAAREREQIVDFVESVSGNQPIVTVLSRGSYVDGVVRLGIQMAEALAYTHARGILHRDLKPSNVLLTPNGTPMLLDFNLASDIEAGAQRLGGTLPYMPPEQIRDVHLQPFEANVEGDPRSDIFSLGVILYELLTGKLPFGDPPVGVAPRQAAEELLAAQQQAPRSVRDLNPAVSSELARLLHECLALEPSQRPASAADLASQLEKYFSPRRRAQRWTSRHPRVLTTLTLCLMLLAAATLWHLATRPTYEIRQFHAGIADINLGRYDEAIEHLDHAIKLRENDVAFLFARGVAYLRLGDYELASSDLAKAAAADASYDPVILECCGYSKMKIWKGTAGSDLITAARYMYGRMTTLEGFNLTAEQELSLAFVYYVLPNKTETAIIRCTAAIDKRPESQEAHYLRALAYLIAVKREMKISSTDRDNDKLRESIRRSREDFEKAISLGPPSARLFADAAEAHAILNDGDEANPTLQDLLKRAARYGTPCSVIEGIGETYGLSKDAWFQDVVSLCASNPKMFPKRDDYRDRFVTAPNNDVVDARLNAFLVQSTQTPR